jgi:transcriptional regulator with PAS, ATPase and Fis domain
MEATYNANKIFDCIDDGIIFLNNKGYIEVMNKMAKEIIGIDVSGKKTHPEGKIQEGDIVIIVDNDLGGDDGNLNSGDLNIINIYDNQIEQGDAIIAIGVHKNKSIKPIYKFWRRLELPLYEIDTEYLGFKLKAYNDLVNKKMGVSFNGEKYEMKYIKNLGFIVVIDRTTGKVKFYQAKGYTVRNEDLNNLLLGSPFKAKGVLELEDGRSKHIKEIIEYSDIIEIINGIYNSSQGGFSNELIEINKTPTLCSMTPVSYDNGSFGILITIKDVSEMEKLLSDRNEVLKSMEKLNKLYNNSKTIDNSQLPSFSSVSVLMNEVKSLALKAAKIKSTVLIMGESGTGKSMLAKEIHNINSRNKPFIHVNCSAIPAGLFESELFGYEKGSFTGAKNEGKLGYFQLANGGTLFLDEIGELPNEIQAKLLHVLQNKSFYRIGGSTIVYIDVRVIVATNKDLLAEVEKGNFREDLYYRINVFPIKIPPLRDRKNDLYILINNILDKLAQEYDDKKQLSGTAFEKLIKYDWPGNVRELENVLERAFYICNSKVIQAEHINIVDRINYDSNYLNNALTKTEKRVMEETLKQCNYDKKLTMQRLEMSKTNFYEKLKKYQIKVPKQEI